MTETRWPCPVCLGVRMDKAQFGAKGAKSPLTLDHCSRCGGMWFELGEVEQMRREKPEALWASIPAKKGRHRAQCHTCRAFVDRDHAKCESCGAKTKLGCPTCTTTMTVVRHGSLTLDLCKQCKGIWFDHHELEEIWKLQRDNAVAKRGFLKKRGSDALEEGAEILGETLFWAPELVFLGAGLAGHAAAGAMNAASALADAAPDVLETVGEAAASVFEVIVEIIGSIFD